MSTVGTQFGSPSSQDFSAGEPILEFSGEHRWLSNFHDYIIDLGGRMFASSEHAFQATKTFDPEEQRQVQLARSPGQAKRIGQNVTLRDDWESAKVDMMRLVVAAKFPIGDTALSKKLLETGDRILVEGNTWGDRFWGACWVELASPYYGFPNWAIETSDDAPSRFLTGMNHLGLLLMQRRQQLKEVTA